MCFKLLRKIVFNPREITSTSDIHAMLYYLFAADGRTFVPTLTYPGVAIFLQNLLIFVASLVYKFGRSEELWG